MAESSIDSACTDPPYALVSIVKRFGAPNAAPARGGVYARSSSGFMGQTWDTGEVAFDPAFWAEVLRVLKPGGYVLAFGGTRTYHRLACAIEDAGFEIRDQIGWAFGSGFPKSHDAGDGRGTALKPAWEPICMARKPLIGTVAENIAAWGTGAINIDSCRVPVTGADARDVGREITRNVRSNDDGWGMNGAAAQSGVAVVRPEGRWPANLVHDGSDEVLATFPDASGAVADVRGSEQSEKTDGIFGDFAGRAPLAARGDVGSAARFFYCAKASKRDREEGCENLPDAVLARSNSAQADAARGIVVDSAGGGFANARIRKNNHPTVKPTELMRWLCRLVTPAGGVILDPFMGSGSTGKAAMIEGFRFVGIEREAAYLTIAQARIEHAMTKAVAASQPSKRDRNVKRKSPPVVQADLFA